MRRPERSAPMSQARELFAAAPYVNVATTSPDGTPMLRCLNGVVVGEGDDWTIAFHGAVEGEKRLALGRAAVVGCEEVVATIPSHFTTRERACPATTWYRSAQIKGVIEEIVDPVERAGALQALMARFQPEGGHRPITHGDPMYDKAVAHLTIARVRPDEITAKQSLGQDKPDETRQAVLRGLWDRGAPGDLEALARSLSFRPATWPAWLQGAGLELHPHVEAPPVLPQLMRQEWNAPFSAEAVARAWSLSPARLAAYAGGELVGTCRAVSDGEKYAYVGDVSVAEAWQGRGVGRALMALLLDHPAVRRARRVILRTRIAEGFYLKLGFRTFAHEDERPWMELRRW